jgi:MFS family permease
LLYQIGAIVAGAATALLCRRVGVKRVQIIAALLYGVGCVIAATALTWRPCWSQDFCKELAAA